MITLQCFMEFSKQSFDRVTRAGRQQKQLKTVVGRYLCRADAPGDVLREALSRLTLYVVDAIHKKPVRSQHTPAVCRQKSLKETGEREREVKRHRLQVHLWDLCPVSSGRPEAPGTPCALGKTFLN